MMISQLLITTNARHVSKKPKKLPSVTKIMTPSGDKAFCPPPYFQSHHVFLNRMKFYKQNGFHKMLECRNDRNRLIGSVVDFTIHKKKLTKLFLTGFGLL